MNPKIWGPHLWFFLHSITFNYPIKPTEEDKKNYLNFFENLYKILPCDKCAKHYQQNIKEKPLTKEILNSRDKLIEWLIEFHNNVNKYAKKTILTKKEVIDYYLYQYQERNYYPFVYSLILIIIILILIYFI